MPIFSEDLFRHLGLAVSNAGCVVGVVICALFLTSAECFGMLLGRVAMMLCCNSVVCFIKRCSLCSFNLHFLNT